ncbi:MAG: HAMP domain-containing protein [Alphaproteobacteria bacterium]|nr:HAMP domain-containing protein [Alphaproteobacteria bacterium]
MRRPGMTAAMMAFLTRSIPGRILGAFLGIYLVTYGTTALVVYSGARASILESEMAALRRLADLKFGQLSNIIGAFVTDLTVWSSLDVMNDLVSGDVDKRVVRTLEELKRIYRLSGEIYAFNAEGKLVASSRGARDDARKAELPPVWQSGTQDLLLVGKAPDPMSGSDVVVFEKPIFASFDKTYRVGTLVMTYPWAAIEKLFAGSDNDLILYESGERRRVLAESTPGLAAGVGDRLVYGNASGIGADYVIVRSAADQGLIGNWRVLALQRSSAASAPLLRVALELALLGVLLAVPIVLLGRWLSARLTAPIAELTRVAGEISDTDRLDARVPVPETEELGALARSFNRMTAGLEVAQRDREALLRDLTHLNQNLEGKIAERTRELEDAVEAQKRLLGDISHEIKSPLARLGMALELARRVPEADRPIQFARIETEIETISDLTRELLTLARLDQADSPAAFAPVDLTDLLARIAADAAYERPERAPDMTLHAPENPVFVPGDEALLRRAIENVVRNALFYTAPGTPVRIDLEAAADGSVLIRVADRGPGVAEAELARLFEPFYRVDVARGRATGGTGIGLTICRRVVQHHGGTVKASANAPSGLVVDIRLPADPDPAQRPTL